MKLLHLQTQREELERVCRGRTAFGGVAQWPAVTARLPFPHGEEKRAARFAQRLMAMIEEEFK